MSFWNNLAKSSNIHFKEPANLKETANLSRSSPETPKSAQDDTAARLQSLAL
jgi:hypothetical protein